MAAHERLNLKSPIAHLMLTDKLAKELSNGAAFKLYHVSTPPSRTSALHSALPGERPDRTYCESHFLTASINISSSSADNGGRENEVLVFAIEILIYSTAYLTTIFISKADSTGYLHHLNLPKGGSSPLRDISSAFVAHLVEGRRRQGIRCVVSLFARAQDQYLFPGSVENSGKHVLDDRGLVKWWCRVLDPLVETSGGRNTGQSRELWVHIRGYLIIPGLDDYESRSYLPKGSGSANATLGWTIGHPLKELSRHQRDMPPRCLVPRFPDDPKSRFLDELDNELSNSRGKSTSEEWKSVKTLDQFWEMMAFRQECSAGRLVGFIWMVFEPAPFVQTSDIGVADSQSSAMDLTSNSPDGSRTTPAQPARSSPSVLSSTPLVGPCQSQDITLSPSKQSKAESALSQQSIPSLRTNSAKKKRLSGPIIARQPRIKTETRLYRLEVPEKTPYYVWPQESRGQVVVEEKDYKRITELLLRLDFANLDLAASSTRRWINEVRSGVTSNAVNRWGIPVAGTRAFEIRCQNGASGVMTLNVGLIRKKRKGGAQAEIALPMKDEAAPGALPPVNMLGAGMVRKKAKA